MILRATQQDSTALFDCIGSDYAAALYLYIDIKKYGFSHPAMKVWLDKQPSDGSIRAIIMQYYTGMVVYSPHQQYDAAGVAQLIQQQRPAIISGMQQTLSDLLPHLPGYSTETGRVAEIRSPVFPHDPEVTPATQQEMRQIATLLMEDEGLGGHHQIDTLCRQLTERMQQGFGRNYVLRREGQIVAHAASYAELDDIAVVSGVVTAPAWRGKGLMQRVYSTLCGDLLAEGKRVFACYYLPAAKALHLKIGFEDRGGWQKLMPVS